VAKTVYTQVVNISQEYLGPAAERFVNRIIAFHLKKDPGQLTAKDLPKLSEWMKVSIALLTDDKSIVDDYAKKILKLSPQGNGQ
jgi:hypothetical protein